MRRWIGFPVCKPLPKDSGNSVVSSVSDPWTERINAAIHSKRAKVARKRLTSGETKEYYYDRQTGQFLSHNRDDALARLASQPSPPAPGTIADLVVRYLDSSHFRTRLKPRTQNLYRDYLNIIRREYGDLPIAGLRPGTIELIKSQFEDTPRKANLIIVLLRIILARAVKWELIPRIPALKPDLLPTLPRYQVWTADDEDRFLAAARPSLRLAIMLMLYTVQRPNDCLAMTTSRVSEREGRLYIALRQQSTERSLMSLFTRDLNRIFASDWPRTGRRSLCRARTNISRSRQPCSFQVRPGGNGLIETFAAPGIKPRRGRGLPIFNAGIFAGPG